MSTLSIPSLKPLKNNSHQLSLGNAIVYFVTVQTLFLPICTISEEFVTVTLQAVDGSRQVTFCINVIIVLKSLKPEISV